MAKKIQAIAALLFSVLSLTSAAAPIIYKVPSSVTINEGEVQSVLPVVVAGAGCAASTSKNTGISADYKSVYTCNGGVWQPIENVGWGAPVSTFASLPLTDAAGTARLVTGLGRVFVWNGTVWSAWAVDQNGNMTISGQVTAASAAVSGNVSANTVTSAGAISSGSITSNSTTLAKGRLTVSVSNWGAVLRDSAGADNAVPQSATGSVYANDVYIRAKGKWLSELNAGVF